jgi:hypothetical protein
VTARNTRIMRTLLRAAAFVLLAPLYAGAQPYLGSARPDAGTIELGGGVLWTRGYDAGGGAALETRNTGTGTGPLTLFETDSQMLSTTGAGAQIGVYLSRRISAEAVFQYSRPILRLRATSDFENADPVSIDGQVTTYVAGGSLLYHFGDGRFVPFVSGGGAYVRQLHEDNAVAITGTEIHAGGGVKLWFGSASRVGVRLDAQVSSRDKAVAFEEKRRIIPTLGAGLTVRF